MLADHQADSLHRQFKLSNVEPAAKSWLRLSRRGENLLTDHSVSPKMKAEVF